MQSDDIKIYDLTTFTLLDFPDTPAAIIWLAGCNMRCPYCHNPDIVLGRNELDFDSVLTFLQKRKNVLEGVVLSGGEPTIHPHLIQIAEDVKALGYKIKLDTNATRPKVLENLLQRDLLDYVALDFKASPQRYKEVTSLDGFFSFLHSLRLLQKSAIPFEIRTTVHPDLIRSEDMATMLRLLQEEGYRGSYFIQKFVHHTKLLGSLEESQENFDTSICEGNWPFTIAFRNF